MLSSHAAKLVAISLLLAQQICIGSGQLPDDIQRELNNGLAEQAKLQAIREQQQRLLRARQMGAAGRALPASGRMSPGAPGQQQQAQPIDPNNYSFQQVSPPVQYSYFQPYGDTAAMSPQGQQQASGAGPATGSASSAKPMPKMDFDLNNLNFELPKPQARVSNGAGAGTGAGEGSALGYQDDGQHQPARSPQFVGVGGLPLMAAGNAPLAPQARTAAAPQAQPLTEADFRDITGGENYGAPSGSGGTNHFGLGQMGSTGDDFGGLASGPSRGSPENRASGSTGLGGIMEDPFGGAGFGAPANNPQQRRGSNNNNLESSLEALAGEGPARQMGGGNGGGGDNANSLGNGGDFDFASQPSRLREQDDSQLDQAGEDGQNGHSEDDATGGGAAAPMQRNEPAGAPRANGAPPNSLQSLLGASFPGLSGSPSRSSWENQFQPGQQQQQRSASRPSDPSGMDMADLGERADGFAGADLGGFEQPSPTGDQDFQLAGAAASPQPSSVLYPDGGPQFVGTLLAVSQPQSLSQTRYSPQPDHGTFQDYPGYQSGGNNFDAVAHVVDNTPKARRSAPGRYANPSPYSLAPEIKSWLPRGRLYDYSQAPAISALQQLY